MDAKPTSDLSLWEKEAPVRQAFEEGNDPATAALLFRMYGVMITKHCIRMVGNAATGEDLASETFGEILKSLRRTFIPGSCFQPWVFGIARNMILRESHWRMRWEDFKRRHGADFPVAEMTGVPVELQTIRRLLERCLRRLKPEPRECLLLKYIEGLPYEEVAQVVGCSAENARVQTFRARMQLQACLKNREVEDP